jgi:hypothetical protein
LRRDDLCPGDRVCPYVDKPGLPCSECPLILLDEYLNTTLGQAIKAALDLDFALQIGVRIELSELRYTEFLLLRLLNEERIRHREEELKKASERGQQSNLN